MLLCSVDLHKTEIQILAGKQILSQHSHSGTDFEDIPDPAGAKSVDDSFRYVLISQKMLT